MHFFEVMGLRCLCAFLAICLLVNAVGCVRKTDASLSDSVVLIDPGHGGFDGGTTAEDGTIEKHLNLAVALCLRDLLMVCGVPVVMTRDTDIGLDEDASASIRNRKVSDMKNRLAMYEAADVVITAIALCWRRRFAAWWWGGHNRRIRVS